jgi:hypothetical protein
LTLIECFIFHGGDTPRRCIGAKYFSNLHYQSKFRKLKYRIRSPNPAFNFLVKVPIPAKVRYILCRSKSAEGCEFPLDEHKTEQETGHQ